MRKEWHDIRKALLARQGNACESCGAKNHEKGYRDPSTGEWIWANSHYGVYIEQHGFRGKSGRSIKTEPIKIVLMIASLDHNPDNNKLHNLRLLCPRCHDSHRKSMRPKIEANGYKAYKYVDHEKLGKWIEDAAKAAGK